MGSGWIILDSNNTILLETQGRTHKWILSTRYELTAIMHAILCAPKNQKIKIYNDSKATINSIDSIRKQLDRQKNRARTWFKANNSSIISCIIDNLDSKNIDLDLIWVKGHEDNVGNNLVDRVTKEACNSCNNYITVSKAQTACIVFRPMWDQHIIERNVRKFVRQVAETVEQTDWSLNKNH